MGLYDAYCIIKQLNIVRLNDEKPKSGVGPECR